MKKLTILFLLTCAAALLAVSCQRIIINNNGGQDDNNIYDTWKLDKLTVETQVSINGVTQTQSTVVDFTVENCILDMTSSSYAEADFNTRKEHSGYSYDSATGKIRFDGLSLSDHGKAFVLVGRYNVTVNQDKLTLAQPIGLNVDTQSIGERSIYDFHRIKIEE